MQILLKNDIFVLKTISTDTLLFKYRYKGHKNTKYKIDSCMNNKDDQVLSGSEDGYVYIWDLIEVS